MACAEHEHLQLLKLLLIGDSGVGKSCLMVQYSDNIFSTSFIETYGIDFKHKIVKLNGKRVKLQIWDTAGQERYRTITKGYFRSAMGIVLVYDVTQQSTFDNIRYWMKTIEETTTDFVNKILVGNKADIDESKRAVPFAQGQALADEYGIKFFETSAKTSMNVETVFLSIAQDVHLRLAAKTSTTPKSSKIVKPRINGPTEDDELSKCCS